MANQIIENRLRVMQDRKKQLLTMKKTERGNKLGYVTTVINNLKRWLHELN